MTTVHRTWWRRLLDACIPGRRAAIRRYEELVELARRNPPPQRWYDEQIDPTKPAAAAGGDGAAKKE